ncbi:Iron-sulfur assembly protein IscA-like 1 [Picochlorum sp. SENEW3]|nr:Iron-sulfur assembly protein IscA-like 1 [Picochlorum sp. SENEW3]
METVANQHMEQDKKDSLGSPRRRKKASIVELTDSALERMRMLLEKHRKEAKSGDDDVYIRLGVKRRGCNGLAYTLNYDSTKKKFDEEVDYSQPYGVRMLVDAGAIMHVLGTRMDYVEDDLRAEFVFVNPNAAGTCGCGESFTTQSDEFKRAKE